MNIKNLKRAQELLKTLKPEQFDMEDFRYTKPEEAFDKYKKTAECNSVGCIIGHCTILDTENVMSNYITCKGVINFIEWSKYFFEIGFDDKTWHYLFDAIWAENVNTNTPEHAILRIQRVIDGYVPGHINIEFANAINELL
ncbi:hypothetical protein MA9V1_011 [Chryseobacterium phage MA9V-1]|nr:hypothetical protein MA9V1_011 [Chryseobacterium phage MA9V-1]